MNDGERKRAALLEEASRLYCKTGLNKNVMILITVLHLAFIASMLLVKDPNILMPAFVLVSLITTCISMVTTDLIGDRGGFKPEAHMKLNGAVTAGKFLCAMPFEGKDILNLRLINWERQIAEKSAMTILIQIILMIERAMGLEFSPEFLPSSCGVLLPMFLGEAFIMAECMSKNFKKSVLYGAVYGIFIMCGLTFLDRQGFLCTLDGFGRDFFGMFYGVSGIIITALLTALLIIAGELAASRKKSVSWELS